LIPCQTSEQQLGCFASNALKMSGYMNVYPVKRVGSDIGWALVILLFISDRLQIIYFCGVRYALFDQP
jgi:hypothetical protein